MKKRIRMLTNVTVRTPHWEARYNKGCYYSANQIEFLKAHPEAWEYETPQTEEIE